LFRHRVLRRGHSNTAPLNNHRLDEFRTNLLLLHRDPAAGDGYPGEQKRDTTQAKDDVVESLHKTNALGLEIKVALEAGDFNRFGELLDVHRQNKKRRSTKISDSRIDRWYEIARENGALGGKLIGAGGGGFLLFYCPNSHKRRLREAIAEEGLREMQFDFDFEGAKVVMDF
jgi:D-glycero-alpha-D-manno-heptose-7-phosphate kinase